MKPSVAASKVQLALRLATKDGLLRARDLNAQKIPRAYLQRLCDRGELEKVTRGLYRIPDAPVTEHHSLVEVSRRVPHATICLLSALQVHELSTQGPHEVWIAIQRHARKPALTYPPVHVVRMSGRALTFGVEVRAIEGVKVRITSPAKTVADCFRFRRLVGLEAALDALRDYLKKHRNGIDALMKAAAADRVTNVMRPYVEALV